MIGYVYKLVSTDINITECYVGSTKNMTRRKCEHKSVCNNPNSKMHNLYVYQYIRENGGISNWDMVLVETVEYNIKAELHARERHYIEQLHALLNSQVPTRTGQEYRQDNRENINSQKKEYYHTNREDLIKKSQQYYKENIESITEYKNHYYKNNTQKIKQYREENSSEIKRKKNLYNVEKIMCDYCGITFTQSNKKRHTKSNRHIKNYKQAFLECWGEEFTGTITSSDY